MSDPKLALDESKQPMKKIFEAVANAPVESIPIDTIRDDKENPYRLAHRGHANSKGQDSDEVGHLSSQLEELPLLSPLIVVDHEDGCGPIIASGLKRMRAAKAAEQTHVPVRRLKLSSLFEGDAAMWPDEKKRALLNEALQNVVFTESWSNSKLDDHSTLSLFRTIKSNYGLTQISDFSKVMRRIGLKRDDSTYRNAKRIWTIAVMETLYAQVNSKVIPIGMAKNESIQDAFFQIEGAGEMSNLLNRFDLYAEELRKESPQNHRQPLMYMDGYDASKILSFIREAASKDPKTDDEYVQPQFAVESKDGLLTVAKVEKLDLADTDRPNLSKVLEIFYGLSSVCEQLEKFLKAVRPEVAGGRIDRANNPTIAIKNPEYGDAYMEFVRTWNMHWYCNIQKIDEHLLNVGTPLADEGAKRIAQKKNELADLLFQKFIERERQAK